MTARRTFVPDTVLILFLIFPFLVVAYFCADLLPAFLDLDGGELWWAFKNSALQAFFSALLAVAGGFFIAGGLLEIDSRVTRSRSLSHFARSGVLDWLVMIPAFLPPLFVILAIFKVVDPFPFGVPGIALAHALTYGGMVGVHFKKNFLDTLARRALVAELYGAGYFRFWRLAFPLVRGQALGQFFLVFVASFTSFSIPLVMGGGRGTTLEILVFEKIRIDANVGAALWLSVVQTVLIFGFYGVGSLLAGRAEERPAAADVAGRVSPLLRSRVGVLAVAGSLLLFWGPLLAGLFEGWSELRRVPDIGAVVIDAAVPSMLIAILTGGALAVLFLLASSPWVSQAGRAFLTAWTPASTAFVGLSILLLGSHEDSLVWWKYILGFLVLSAAGLWRMGMAPELARLETQRWIARSYGATPAFEFRWIIVPQVWEKAWVLAGIGAIWILGDFALAKMLIGGESTLPLVIEALIGSYRVDAGLCLGALLFLLSGLFWIFFRGVSRVYR